MKRFSLKVTGASLLATVSWLTYAQAQGLNKFEPYVQASYVYDNNLFKVDEDDPLINSPLLSSDYSDAITALSVGLNFEYNLSQQNFIANVNITDNKFKNNNQFDNVAESYLVQWNWLAGKRLSGYVGAQYDIKLASFIDNQQLALLGSNKKEQSEYARANLSLSERWQVGAEYTQKELDVQEVSIDINDRDSIKTELFLNYKSKEGNLFGISAASTDIEFPFRELNPETLDDNEFQLNNYFLNSQWTISPSFIVNSRFGWEKLEYENFGSKNYSSATFRIVNIWRPTGKLQLRTSIWQEVNPSLNPLATIRRERVFRFLPNWRVSAKQSFEILFEFQNDVLRDNPFTDGNDDVLDEDLITTYLQWNYQPSEHITIQSRVQKSKRQSDGVFRNFDSNLVFLNLQVRW